MENRHISEFKQGDVITRVAPLCALNSNLLPIGIPVQFVCIANGYIYLYNAIDEKVIKIPSHYAENATGWDYYKDTGKLVEEYLQKCAATEQPPAPEPEPESEPGPEPKFDVIAYLKEIDAPPDTIFNLVNDGNTKCTPELIKYLMGTSLSAAGVCQLIKKYFDATEQAELLAYYASVASGGNMAYLIVNYSQFQNEESIKHLTGLNPTANTISYLIMYYPTARTPEMVKCWLSLNPSMGDIEYLIDELRDTGITDPCIHEMMDYYLKKVEDPYHLCRLMFTNPQTRVRAAFDWLKQQNLSYNNKSLICEMVLTGKIEG